MDDILSPSYDAKKTMKDIQAVFKLKDDKIEEPSTYLGAALSKMQTRDGGTCWTMSSDPYCTAAVKNVEMKLAKDGRTLPTKCFNPMISNYQPELDTSPELNAEGLQYYQELIGVL